MNTQIKFFIFGFITASLIGVGSVAALLSLGTSDTRIFHDQAIPAGKNVKVTSFHLVWGIEHDDRDAGKDCFAMEYVYVNPQAETKDREAEAVEVFELIRPVSELWGFRKATVAGFPSLERKGKYDLYAFERKADGSWSYERTENKVFVND